MYFPAKITFNSIPTLYAQSDKEKEKFQLKEVELEKVMKEIHQFQQKQQ